MDVVFYFSISTVQLHLAASMFACNKWKCRCSHINIGYNIANCEACHGSKADGESLIVLPGDWTCGVCNLNNFSKRKVCFQCSSPKSKRSNTKTRSTSNKRRKRPNQGESCQFDTLVFCEDTQEQDEEERRGCSQDVRVVEDSLQAGNEYDSSCSTVDPAEFLDPSSQTRTPTSGAESLSEGNLLH